MAPLPYSLSPHVCILSSPDLESLLSSVSLPPLPQVLQSFSPLPNVNTRTTSLTTVSHASFTLRFSDLVEVEAGCKEDEEIRASRILDWIGARIAKRSAKWIEDEERIKTGESVGRTPWWDELRRCAEGDHIPSRIEGWNHPVAVVLAVSTTAPNPLQAVTALHSRQLELPPWVDSNYLKYTLIVHPENSPLSDEEAGALFNAVKKQYGLNAHLLPLSLPSPPPPPVPVPAPFPRLPPPPSPESLLSPPPPIFSAPPTPQPGAMGSSLSTQEMSFATSLDGVAAMREEESAGKLVGNSLRMHEKDIQMMARFVREFLLMSVIPFMEKCTIEWNESFSSTRRLPSRLFSSTRRLFGSPTPSSPGHASKPSTSSVASRTSISSITSNANGTQGLGPPSQYRRLAEFATILGDIKLAVSVWESLRKDGKGGSEILPLLLAPSPALALHAQHALNTLHPPSPDPPANVQVRALIYAVRWTIGVNLQDYLSSALEGERWLVSSAGSAEEPHSALLLAHAALLSAMKRAKRRAALWYLFAANRLEKCGVRPLTMYFLRKAHSLYAFGPEKNLSPSLWDSEDRSPTAWEGFGDVKPGIEHALGRLLYTTGDVEGAISYFLGLLRRSLTCYVSPQPVLTNGKAVESTANPSATDRIYLEDFRVAFKHFLATGGEESKIASWKLPFSFCNPRQTKIRLPSQGVSGQDNVWEGRQTKWELFQKSRGKNRLENCDKAAVNETFWIDIELHNPLDVEVNLSDVTIVAQEQQSGNLESAKDILDAEVIEDITLAAKESRSIPLALKVARPASLIITHAHYKFLSLLPVTDSLARRGRRLQETMLQRQSKIYAPDVFVKFDVEDASQRLQVNFIDDGRLVMAQGECKRMKLWLSNPGIKSIRELWMVTGDEDELWVETSESFPSPPVVSEMISSSNSLAAGEPLRIPLDTLTKSSSIEPGQSVELTIVFHAEKSLNDELCLLFVFRETEDQPFYSARVSRQYEVNATFRAKATSRPSQSPNHLYLINLEVENVSFYSDLHLSQITTLSPTWKCSPVAAGEALGPVHVNQTAKFYFNADRWEEGGSEETLQFVHKKLGDILHSRSIEPTSPPSIRLLCNHISKDQPRSIQDPSIQHFVHCSRRNFVGRATAAQHPYIPSSSHPYVFSLYNPAALDVVIFWEIPSQQRAGHISVSGLLLGAGHAALKEVIEEAENAKVKRSMYAETHRERQDILKAIRASEWNAEMNPVVVRVEDGQQLQHDFAKGGCLKPVTFVLRNYSVTHPARFVLRLKQDKSAVHSSSNLLPPQYSGRLTYRGRLEPSQEVTVKAKMWLNRPGAYALTGWLVETEVEEVQSGQEGEECLTRTLHRYLQGPSLADRSCTVVTNVKSG
ncbi:hypothetical protein NEOLEDRAFT_1126297 [Neolentinus lepideus HHB14362 ss-1]|uniref:TPPC8 first Ig-like domain-containing protein n=1 Tax=Neolentinus lepideus HHB14362 ss-1 TaxID=1314782 RepID=A0A165W5J3_9AGAM|nr:hypothetical protein NEOLEDRAFT_1126297 [Neolentinus lepideus HHB14362 ss-1]